MKIVKIGAPRVIMSNPQSKHNYFGWPSVTRLQNGKIAVVASGYRLKHVCPFGKTVISYSEDEGETYTLPAPVMDTVLDDRDGGVLAFGKSSVIVTSFNNTLEYQKGRVDLTPYASAYLDTVTTEEEDAALGCTYRISHDCGVTFGPLQKSPITSPHGPLELPDGNLLWVGRTFITEKSPADIKDCISAYIMKPNGEMEHLSDIENIEDNGEPLLSCEPNAILLEDGRILVQIRVQQRKDRHLVYRYFTIYQCESSDGGKTWTKPYPVLHRLGGSPPHLFKHSSGVLLSTYARREDPSAVLVMLSRDNGKTWETDHELYLNGINADMGYPATVELKDGSLLTVFYAHPAAGEPSVILQQKWRIEE